MLGSHCCHGSATFQGRAFGRRAWSRMVSRGLVRAGAAPDPSHPVKLTFKLKRKLQYGFHLVMTGSCPIMGKWDPTKGLQLQWTEGDVWTADAELPSGVKVDYKYVVRSKSGQIGEWQGGANMFVIPPQEAEACDVRDTWEGKSIVNITTAYTPPEPEAPLKADPLEALAAAAWSEGDPEPDDHQQQQQEQLEQVPLEELQPLDTLDEEQLKEQLALLQQQLELEQQQEQVLLQQQQLLLRQQEEQLLLGQLQPSSDVPAAAQQPVVASAERDQQPPAAAAVEGQAAVTRSKTPGPAVAPEAEPGTSKQAAESDGGLRAPGSIGANGHGAPGAVSSREIMTRFRSEWAALNNPAPPLNGPIPAQNKNGSSAHRPSADRNAPPPEAAVSSLSSFDLLDGQSTWVPGQMEGDPFPNSQPPVGGSNGRTWGSYGGSPGTNGSSGNGNGSTGYAQRANGATAGAGGPGGAGPNASTTSSSGGPGGNGSAELVNLSSSDVLETAGAGGSNGSGDVQRGISGQELAELVGMVPGALSYDDYPVYAPAVMVVRTPRMRRVVLTPEGHARSRLGALTINELRHELKKRGLACHGNHTDLVQRLIEAGMEW